MAEIAKWWCQLFGYADCHALSIFESILLVWAMVIALLWAVAIPFVIVSWLFVMLGSRR